VNLNLPNTITVGRILAAPFIAALPFIASPSARLVAFLLYVVAAVTDYYDGMLARTRNLITDLGRLLDPLADKLLLFATLIPMFVLMAPVNDALVPTRAQSIDAARLQFITPFGQIGLPWWVVISAIGPAKWKTGFQSVWVGSAYFWFFAATLARAEGWTSAAWFAFANFNGIVGTITMIASVFLTLYSLVLYLRRYAVVFAP